MRTRLRTLAAAFVLAVLAAAMPQVASPAAAAPEVNDFYLNDIVKIKTTWGSGYVTNFGGTNGSYLAGRYAQIHWNFSWDHPNRFEVIEAQDQYGERWFKLKNRHSGLCLAAWQLWGGGYVQQEKCTDTYAYLYWAAVSGLDGFQIRNLAFRQANLNMVMTQYTFEWVGSHIIMKSPANPTDVSRQRWVIQTCRPGSSELKDC
jgi:hypothetical protein